MFKFIRRRRLSKELYFWYAYLKVNGDFSAIASENLLSVYHYWVAEYNSNLLLQENTGYAMVMRPQLLLLIKAFEADLDKRKDVISDQGVKCDLAV